VTLAPVLPRARDGGPPLRIAVVAPVATPLPPAKSGSVELVTALLADGLVEAGHDVTLFAAARSRTAARLHARFEWGYWHEPTLWPWELCETLTLSDAVERAGDFDLIHHQAASVPVGLGFARICPVPLLQTVHHAPGPEEVALWRGVEGVRFVAISREQERLLEGLRVVGAVPHGLDTDTFAFRAAPNPDAYLLFLGRFMEGKGPLQAIEVARRAGLRIVLAAAENEYYREYVAPRVDGRSVVYFGEAGHDEKVRLLGGAMALLYPLQEGEPFGLVLAEAMACGTPVAALDRGAVREVVDDGLTGRVFDDLDQMVDGLPEVFALDRAAVRARAVQRYGVRRMVDGYVDVYRQVLAEAGHG